jgi:hypothetical protein
VCFNVNQWRALQGSLKIKPGNCRNELMLSSGLELVQQSAMPALLQKTLKVVPAPLIEGVPSAPPALAVPNPTVECKCGNCGAVLMRGNESKVYPLVVLCISCGSYNSTDA